MVAKNYTKNSKIPYLDEILTPFDDKNDEKVIKIHESRRKTVVTKSPPPRLFSLGNPINLPSDLIEVKKKSALYICVQCLILYLKMKKIKGHFW